jgi:acetyl-CoA carboxylase biotin carboxyl carrier protein
VDLARLRELIQLMDRNQLAELEIEEEGFRVKLRKRGEPKREWLAVGGGAFAAPAAPYPAAAAAGGGDTAAPVAEANLVRAPMVGTFYRSPSPDTDPFVDVGDKIEEGQVLGIIEAMKVMNEVKADRAGTIEAVLAENGVSVEYGTPLFRVG